MPFHAQRRATIATVETPCARLDDGKRCRTGGTPFLNKGHAARLLAASGLDWYLANLYPKRKIITRILTRRLHFQIIVAGGGQIACPLFTPVGSDKEISQLITDCDRGGAAIKCAEI